MILLYVILNKRLIFWFEGFTGHETKHKYCHSYKAKFQKANDISFDRLIYLMPLTQRKSDVQEMHQISFYT